MKTKITVTQEDIENSVPGDSTECPIALAVRRVTGNTGVRVGRRHILGSGAAVDLPESARRFISRFDNPRDDEVFKPFTFTLDLWIYD